VTSLQDSARFATATGHFIARMRHDAVALARFRAGLRSGPPAVPEGLLSCAHKLAGASGIFDFPAVSALASALEDSIIEARAGRGTLAEVDANLTALIERIESE